MKEIPHCEMQQFHYQALKDPEYQIEGMMDCLREEVSCYLPALEPEVKGKAPELEDINIYRHYPHQHRYTRKQAGRLFFRIEQLGNSNRYLLKKIKELTAYASKRRPKNYKYKDT